MKRNIIINSLVLFCLFLAVYSCKKVDVSIEGCNEISFTAGVNAEMTMTTRASLSTPEIGDIGLFAFSNERDVERLFNNTQLVKGADNNYTYIGDKRYYINDEDITYFAYTPYDENAVVTLDRTFKTMDLDYTITQANKDDCLFMSNTHAINQKQINLEFKPLLAAVGFKIIGSTNYRVTKLSICQMYNKAKITLLNDGTISYSEHEVTSYDDSVLDISLADDTTPNSDGTPKNIINDDGYIMVLPQVMPANTGIILEISPADQNSTEVPKEFYLPLCEYDVWENSKLYIYTLNIDVTI